MPTVSCYPHKAPREQVRLYMSSALDQEALRSVFGDQLDALRFSMTGDFETGNFELFTTDTGRKLWMQREGRTCLVIPSTAFRGTRPTSDIRYMGLQLTLDPDHQKIQFSVGPETFKGKTVLRGDRRDAALEAESEAEEELAAVEPSVASSTPHLDDMAAAKNIINSILVTKGFELVEVVIEDGKIKNFKIRRDEIV